MSGDAFPRGSAKPSGGDAAPARKRKAKAEFLFGAGGKEEVRGGGDERPKKKAKASKAGRAKRSKGSGDSVGLGMLVKAGKAQYLKLPSNREMSLGTQFVGVVVEVKDSHVKVSLPNALVGRVQRAEISEHFAATESSRAAAADESTDVDADAPLASLFTVGQAIRCVLRRMEVNQHNKRLLHLTTHARAVNRGIMARELRSGMPLYGTVASKEDHGYVIETGIDGVTAFLPQKSTGTLRPGQPVETLIQGRKGQALILAAPPAARLYRTKVTSALRFQALQAGMLVEGVVERAASNGIILSSILGAFSGAVPDAHLEEVATEEEWQKHYTIGRVLTARIIYVDHKKDAVLLSLRPHILRMNPRRQRALPAIGDILEDAEVISIKPGVGALLAVPSGAGDEDATLDEVRFHAGHAQQGDEQRREGRRLADCTSSARDGRGRRAERLHAPLSQVVLCAVRAARAERTSRAGPLAGRWRGGCASHEVYARHTAR